MENSNANQKLNEVGNILNGSGKLIILGLIMFFLLKFLFFKPQYENYKNCGKDLDKWEKVVNSLVDAAVDDIEDGVWDDKEYNGWMNKRIDITNYVQYEVGDEMLGAEVIHLFKNKLNNLNNEYPNIEGVREKVTIRLGLQFE